MKSFKKLLSEVAQPRSGDEQNFKDKHIVQVSPHPVAHDHQHTGDTSDGVANNSSNRTKRKAKRLADYDYQQDVDVYEGMDLDDEGLEQRYERERKKEIKDKIIDEKKLDPVGQEDGDIDNDGDVDDSDKYLHNRRKVIAKAMKESLEEITEKAKSEAQQKAAAIALAVKRGEKPKSELIGASREMFKMSETDLEDFARTKHKGIPYKVDEEVELDEISKKTLGSYVRKAADDMAYRNASKSSDYANTADGHKAYNRNNKKRVQRQKGIDLAVYKMTGESAMFNDNIAESNQMAAIGRKLQQLAPKEKNDMIANAMANLGDHLESYGTTFGARSMKELEKKTGLTSNIIQMLIKRAGATVNEDLEITEISKAMLGRYVKKAADDMAGNAYVVGANDPLKPKAGFGKSFKRQKGIAKAVGRLTKEDLEITEISKDTLKNYISKKSRQIIDKDEKSDPYGIGRGGSSKERNKDFDKLNLARKKLTKEEVEQINELKKSTLASYVKKATPSAMSHGVKGMDYKNDNQSKHFNKAMNRMIGIQRAADKLAKEEVELDEALEKETIKHPVGKRPNGIGWTLKSAGEQTGKDHSVWERKIKRVGGNKTNSVKEEVDLDEISKDLARNYYRKASKDIGDQARSANDLRGGSSDLKGRLNRNYNRDGSRTKPEDLEKDKGIISRYDASRKTAERKIGNRAKGMSRASARMEEVDLDEAKTDIYHKHMLKALGKTRLPKDHSYTSAIANNGDFVVHDGGGRVVGRIPKGDHDLKESAFVAKAAYAKQDDKKHFTLGKKKFPVTIKKDVADEITEDLNENFKTGSVKLNDGSSVLLKKQDADLLNRMFKDLTAGNRKKMMDVAMTDKVGFDEILSFAREAL